MISTRAKQNGMHESRVYVVADVDDASTGVAVVVHPRDGAIRMLSARRMMLPREGRVHEARMAGVLRILSEAAESVADRYAREHLTEYGPVEAVYVVAHAPWMRGRVMRSVSAGDEATPVDDTTIAEHLARMRVEYPPAPHTTFFDESMLAMEVNGYRVASALGKHAQTLGVTVLTHEGDSAFLAEARNRLQRVFPTGPVSFLGASRVIDMLADGDRACDEGCLHVAATHERLHVVVMRDGVVVATAEVPCGKEGDTDDKRARVLAHTIAMAAHPHKVHPVVFVTGEPEVQAHVARLFTHPSFAPIMANARRCRVVPVGGEHVAARVCDDRGVADAQTALACAYVHKRVARE